LRTISCKKVRQQLTDPQLIRKSPAFYRTHKVYYLIHKHPQPVPILRQINPIHAPSHFFKNHFSLSSYPRLGLPSALFVQVIPLCYVNNKINYSKYKMKHLMLCLTVNIHIYFILPSIIFPSKFPHQNPVYASHLPHSPYMLRPSNSSLFYHPINIE